MSKLDLIEHYNNLAPIRHLWKKKNSYYYEELERLINSIVPKGCRVFEAGCGTGELLASTNPSYGVGIDISPKMLEIAKTKFPHLKFLQMDVEDLDIDEKFDYVIVSDLIGELHDIYKALKNLRRIMTEDSRLIITYYNFLWEPVIKLGERLGLKMPQKLQNWLSMDDIRNLLYITGFDVVSNNMRFLIPKKIPLIADFINRYLAELPIIRHFCLVQYFVARKIEVKKKRDYSVSIVIAC
ncbi:MAG: class I SAM-dependent methyltransferase, partial [bacterium]|nr:class I SAM-dependent methyltransferase [bacterium]